MLGSASDAYRNLRGIGDEFGGQGYEVVGLGETDTEQEVLDIVLLQARRFDDGGQPGVAVRADGGSVSKGKLAEDNDGAKLTLGAIVVEFGAGDVQKVQETVAVFSMRHHPEYRRDILHIAVVHGIQVRQITMATIGTDDGWPATITFTH